MAFWNKRRKTETEFAGIHEAVEAGTKAWIQTGRTFGRSDNLPFGSTRMPRKSGKAVDYFSV
jgi:hypothetical protein